MPALRDARTLLFAAFSLWLMHSSFDYLSNSRVLNIGDKVWSDFAHHIPLIRSFSHGDNWPPQSPLYSGPPIRYHWC